VRGSWAHNEMCNNKRVRGGLLMTLILGGIFLFIQFYEYYRLGFNMRTGVWGRMFFFGTGFHGFHVFLGVSVLMISFFRSFNCHFGIGSHCMFEAGLVY